MFAGDKISEILCYGYLVHADVVGGYLYADDRMIWPQPARRQTHKEIK